MHLMLNFFRRYPSATLLVLFLLLLSVLAEGIGVSALLPVLNLAIANEQPGVLAGADTKHNALEQMVIDLLNSFGVQPTLGPMLMIIAIAALVKSILLLISQQKVGYMAAQIATDLRLDVLRSILRSQWSFFLNQPTGKLSNTMSSEAQRAAEAYVFGTEGVTFFIQFLVYGAIAVAISWQAALFSLIAGAFIVGASHFLVRIARKAGLKQTKLMSSLMARLTDTLRSVKPLKAMAREHLADQVLALETTRLNKALRRQIFSAAMLNALQDLMFTLFIVSGIYLALVTFKMELASVMMLVVALGRSFAFLSKVQKQYQKVAQSESAYWALQKTLDQATASEEHLGGRRQPVMQRDIRLQDAGVCYGEHRVFKDLSLTFPAGSFTTIIGPSGVGKTTIIDLVIGLQRPAEGQVLLDDVPLHDMDLKQWRRMIGYVPQDTVLLHESILHNVTLGDDAVTVADVERALRDAGAWDFVAGFPEGLNTVVGEQGGKLSGGQRQRIAIARALVNRPQVLILDEATSALDATSEAEIRDTLAKLKGALTILAISHNAAIAEAADRVYRIESGGVELL